MILVLNIPNFQYHTKYSAYKNILEGQEFHMFRALYFQKFLEVCISTNVSYPTMFHTLQKFCYTNWKMFHTLDTNTPAGYAD